MARPIPPQRFAQLIDVATSTLVTHGYQRTQMADIAKALGVAKGTLYGYVESKDALFDAAIRFADRRSDLPSPETLPVKTQPPGETARYVRERLVTEAADMALVGIIQGSLVIDDPAEELSTVLGDIYSRLARNRFAIKLIDRCAGERPELAEVWFGQGRWPQYQLLMQLIRRRIDGGSYRPCGHPEIAARMLLETIAFWALHRHFDPSPQDVDDATAQGVAIDLLALGLLEARSC